MRHTLFVFGSFADGMVHFKKLEPHVESATEALVYGSVYRLPSGMTVFAEGGTGEVRGVVVTLRSPEILLALLDEFHGVHRADYSKSLFLRREINARTEDETILTDIYAINPDRLPRGAKLIEDADWRRNLAERPPLFSKLSDRQRTYIQRLGSCSGRDIVPIDLGLYRELMHLEIVIDKGRRLALTPLGQELFRLLN